ncbi:hypothetical protein K501DRAFT_271341 [Backusella circina FSU 941]|nr:hypothetical protein K501DRAFT_271341 [Backusella circina FSU 941]
MQYFIISLSNKESEKAVKSLVIKPISDQMLVISKPRITEKDASRVESTFEIFIIIIDQAGISMVDDIVMLRMTLTVKYDRRLPKVQKFLMQAISGDYAIFLDVVMSYKADNNHSKNEKYILIDYHANCEKPAYYTGANKRTPYCEHIIIICEQRSALVPRDWEDRMYWVKTVELLMKLNELLTEQEEVTQKLKKEHAGLIKVKPKYTIKNALSKN